MDPNTGWSTEARSSLVTLQPDGFPLSGVVPKKGEPWTQWHVMALLAAIAGLVGPELRQALIEACFRYANLSRDEWFMKRRELARLWGLTPEQREEFFSIQVSEVAFFKARFLREALDRAARQPEGSRVRLCIEEMRADYESVLRAAIVRKREDQGPGLLASLTERAEGRTRRPRGRRVHGSPRKSRAPGDDDPPGDPSGEDAVRAFLEAVTRWERGEA